MKRITPTMVVEAYKQIGARPIRGSYGDTRACCGLGAISFAGGCELHGNVDWLNRNGYSLTYRESFGHGFDGKPMLPHDNQLAYADGVAAWNQISLEEK